MTPTATNVHGTLSASWSCDLLYLKGCWLAVGGWWLVAVGSWRLAVGSWGRLVVVGGWQFVVGASWQRLAVGGPWGLSLRAVLSKNKIWHLKDSPALPPLN